MWQWGYITNIYTLIKVKLLEILEVESVKY